MKRAIVIALLILGGGTWPVYAHEFAAKDHEHDTTHEHSSDYESVDYGKKVTALYKFKDWLKSGASVQYEVKRDETTILWETVLEFGPEEQSNE